jgi:hypothetical protein
MDQGRIGMGETERMIMEADNMIVIRRRKAITIRRSKEKGKDKSLTKKTTKHAATRKMAKSK